MPYNMAPFWSAGTYDEAHPGPAGSAEEDREDGQQLHPGRRKITGQSFWNGWARSIAKQERSQLAIETFEDDALGEDEVSSAATSRSLTPTATKQWQQATDTAKEAVQKLPNDRA